MIQNSPQMRMPLAMEPVDFKKRMDGPGWTMRDLAKSSVTERGASLKILMYDGQGFWLCRNTDIKLRKYFCSSWRELK